MNFEIKKCGYEESLEANRLLTELIKDEKKYDKNINENCVVKSLYESFYDKQDVCLLVASMENKSVGYIYGYVQNNGDAKKDTVCTLDALFVLENYRNLGVATKLIENFINWSKEKKAHYIELKVCNLNEKAIKLYEKFNFAANKIIMVKEMEKNYNDSI